MRTFYENHRVIIHKILFLIGFVLAVYLFLNHLFIYVSPFVFGWILSLILNPATGFLEKRCKIPRGISALLLIIICIFLIGVIGTSIASRIGREASSFSENFPKYVEDVRALLADTQSRIDGILEYVPDSVREAYNNALSQLMQSLAGFVGSGVGEGSVGLVKRLPGILMTILLTIISTFFFIKDKRVIHTALRSKTPDWLAKNLSLIRKRLLGALGGYVKAQLIIMSVTSAIAILGMTILRSPYALLLGLIISIVDALPVFGSGFILWPWIAVALLSGQYSLALGLGILYLTILLTRQFLEPKVLGQQIGLHPLLTLMSMYAGVRVFGLLGFLVGPVIVLVIKTIMTTDLAMQPTANESIESENA